VKKIVHFIDIILSFIENWILFLAVIVALGSLFANVVLRYGFNYSLGWAEELVREVIIVTTFIGASAAIRRRAMIKIDALAQLVPVVKKPLTMFSHLATLIFAVIMFYYGWKMAALQVMTHQKTIILQVPLVYLYAILPTMAAFMFIRTLQMVYYDIQEFRNPLSESEEQS
jgi:TRAP-type C4-dicarboxylate transport system permease small subunit